MEVEQIFANIHNTINMMIFYFYFGILILMPLAGAIYLTPSAKGIMLSLVAIIMFILANVLYSPYKKLNIWMLKKLYGVEPTKRRKK